jgi:NDP-hexose 4-ketoreductase
MMRSQGTPFEVVGRGMVAQAFNAAAIYGSRAIICASGVSDSQCSDELAFQRERTLLDGLTRRAQERDAMLVYFSAAPVYGRTTQIRTETSKTSPETPYALHKVDCESLIAKSGARHLVLRLPNIVGARGHPNQLVPSLIAQSMAGSVQIRRGATRDLIDVDDVVRIVAGLISAQPPSAILNVASGRSTPVSRLAEIISNILGVAPNIHEIEGGDRQEFSTARIREVLPDYPRFETDYPIDVLTRRVPSIESALHVGTLR